MPGILTEAILELAERSEPAGLTMGYVVDALEGQGYQPNTIEQEIWRLLAERRLTPCGYVCRKVRRRDAVGEIERARSYEFLLVPWSPDLDRQLELALPEGGR